MYCFSAKNTELKRNSRRTDNSMDKRTSNDAQNITQKTKDRATRTPQSAGIDPGAMDL